MPEPCNIPRWIPLLTPAVSEERCEIDSDLITKRILVAAGVAFGFLALAFVGLFALESFPLYFTMLGCGLLVLVITAIFERIVAKRGVDEKAVNEYLTQANPSTSAVQWMSERLRAVELLVHKKGDLNKFDKKGRDLARGLLDFEIFKYLVDQGFDLLKPIRGGLRIQYLLIEGSYRLIEYGLAKIRSRLTTEQQLILWATACSEGLFNALKKAGIDIDAQDKDSGLTFLHVVASNHHKPFCEGLALLPPSQVVKWLIQNGAKIDLTDKNGQTALSLCESARFSTADERQKIIELLTSEEDRQRPIKKNLKVD